MCRCPSGKHLEVHALRVDCGRYSPDRASEVCQRNSEAGLGVFVVVLAVGLLVGYIFYRRIRRKYGLGSGTEAEYEAAREELRDDYREKLESGDPIAREGSRDWYDNTATPWRLDAGFSLGIAILFGSLVVLIPFFVLIKSLTD
jgi:VIT1/CCC1 family predicted Fe2+/Mn2+ transporter